MTTFDQQYTHARAQIEGGDWKLRAEIADLEAANILLNNTINVQLQVIREHQAADVIAVEALRSQAEEITRLRAVIEKMVIYNDFRQNIN